MSPTRQDAHPTTKVNPSPLVVSTASLGLPTNPPFSTFTLDV
ncbi:MAG: hypothetical protein NTX04_02200 [Verrucomicrobia bacterium]|nr:hypothetical protein [Verrucomicrobiota bacterium]